MPTHALAGEFRDLTLEQALQRLQQRGLDILYSSDLIQPSMTVQAEPRATEPHAILMEILRPHGIAISDGPNGRVLLVRDPSFTPRDADAPRRQAPMPTAALEELVVSASRYQFVRELALAPVSMSADELQTVPTLGDDALRATARLPGTAASDYSARANIRGGAADETLVRFDGLRLEDPFHLRSFQSMVSAIGPNVVNTMKVYTGAFPVEFGDRMSGVIDIDPLPMHERAYHELALSFFSTSAVVGRRLQNDRGEWLLAARRGNLDLAVDAMSPDVGRPSYTDFYGRARRQVSETLSLAANAFVIDDAVTLFNSDQEEHARANFTDAYAWLRADYAPSPALNGSGLLAHSTLESHRRGRADQEGVARGTLDDERAFDMTSLQTDWSAQLHDAVLLQFGGEWRRMSGHYDYRDEVHFEVLFDTPGAAREAHRVRAITASPQGAYYAAYVNARVDPAPAIVVDAGLRWDRQTLTPSASDQWNPRVGLVYALSDRTRARLSWGRYSQSQSITELQAADGVVEFSPPQQAEHLIASIEHELGNGIEARMEVYRKNYRRVHPRFENLLNSFVLLPELKPDRIRIAPTRAWAQGAELTLKGQMSPTFNWWLSYAWSSAKDEIDALEVPRSWDQEHALSSGFTWRHHPWTLSIAGTYHSGWPTTAVTLARSEPIPIVTAAARNHRRLGDYRSIDLRAARTFMLAGAGELTAFLEISNIANRSNPCCVEYEFEHDTGNAGLDLGTRSYLPLVPWLGVVWRF